MEVIKELVAPIALFPDVLISQILPAATFPIEVVSAARWVEQHPVSKGLRVSLGILRFFRSAVIPASCRR